jgi:peptide/nickel transport system substrate-binding protein
MGLKRAWMTVVVFATAIAIAVGVASALGAQGTTTSKDQGSQQGDTTLKIGWAQNPDTINPFVGQDEEAFSIWAINWDLLVNFSSKDLTPVPGIAESWDISDDKRTITFHLDPNAKWSDGKPITSEDVKWSLEVLGGKGALFTSYTDNVTSIETPDQDTVVVHTKRPDARIVGGLFIYILPKHVWGKVPVSDLTGSYDPKLPLVGSGPFIVTDFQPNRITTMEKNPYFRGPEPKFDEIQFIRYGNQDAAERALQVGEVDMVPEVSAAGFARIGEEPNIDTLKASSPAYTQMAFNSCPKEICPDANYNPAIQDPAVRQATAYAVDRERINQIAARDTSFPAHGILPSFYKSFYEVPADDYPYDPEKAKQILDDAGWQDNGDSPRTKGDEELSFNLYVRSESPYNIQAAKLVAEQAKAVGINYDVQVTSTDKLYDLTVRKVNGKPAPDYDTFIWGWGGDPYDPSFLLSILTTGEIGGSSDSDYSNPTYDRLFKEQAGSFDTEERKQIIQRMVALTQRDLPYLVLTYDPNLEAYRTDRVANVTPVCPEDPTGDAFCDQTSYEPLLTIAPGSSSGESGGGGSGIAIAAVAVVVVGVGAFFVIRSRRRRSSEPMEVEE